jgi:hypothetical protein
MIYDLSKQKDRNEYAKSDEEKNNPKAFYQAKNKPKFFQAVLKEVKGDVLEHVYGKNHKMTIKERLGNDEGSCPECNGNSWIILAEESCARVEGGKPYIECMHCGTSSHL